MCDPAGMDFSGTGRVLWIIDHLGYDGVLHGGGMYCLNTIPGLRKSAVPVTLCVLRKQDGLSGTFLSRSVDLHHLNRHKFDPGIIMDITGIIRRKQAALIHAHGYGASNYGRVCGGICGIPVIVHAHDADLNYPWYQGVADALLKNRMVGVIAVSEFVKAACVAKRSVRPENVHVLNNGIELGAFVHPSVHQVAQAREKLGLDPGSRVVGAIGRLSREKGMRYLLEAFPIVLKDVPDAVLVIAGEGVLRKELEDCARDLGIMEQLRFAGFYPDVPTLLALCEVVAIPSLSEGLSLVMLESMAMGKPIVATNVGGMREVLTHGKTGLLVPPQAPEPLAGGITKLLRDEDMGRRLGRAAKEASRQYAVDDHVRSLVDIYRMALKRRRSHDVR